MRVRVFPTTNLAPRLGTQASQLGVSVDLAGFPDQLLAEAYSNGATTFFQGGLAYLWAGGKAG